MWFLSGPGALLAIIWMGMDYPNALHAAHNDGHIGTFTTTKVEFTGKSHDYYGKFVSDDGIVHLKETRLDSGAPEKGATVRAQYVDGERVNKVYNLNSREYVLIIGIVLAGIGYLIWWIWRYVVSPMRHRVPRS